ncbi:hypothetical protein PVAND_016134 [Polypedilum vanderplanki]|uniref:SGF29 C-terminal domain-containing protein n=1 Tax=Polypedilum vanderplanki TaxID=319348 RepID=A0A9J6BEY5_POLVA|nr:hypothetical protein PVAND_016134 [Polypedilum vanderplanki]
MQGQTKIQERLRGIQSLIHEIEEARNASESTINKLSQNNTPSTIKQALQDAEKEERLIRQALSKIYEIHTIRNESRIQARNSGQKEMLRKGQLMKMLQISAQTLPLYVSKPGEKLPPLVGCIPANSEYTAKAGDMVAALTKVVDKGSDEENWIMAEVISYNFHTQKYEIHDIDEEQKPRHILSRRRVIPLPLYRANPETDPIALFPKGSVVMALYPQTTCFYKAIINDLPANASKDYEVLFEDSTYANGYSDPMFVAQRFVISIKQRKS